VKVLLDEDLPHKLRLAVIGHDVSTVAWLGWNGLKNGVLLRTAEAAGIDVLVTGDQNLSYQQNLKERSLCMIVLSSPDWPDIKRNLAKIQSAINAAEPGAFRFVELDGLP
jgi:hypothetical protein